MLPGCSTDQVGGGRRGGVSWRCLLPRPACGHAGELSCCMVQPPGPPGPRCAPATTACPAGSPVRTARLAWRRRLALCLEPKSRPSAALHTQHGRGAVSWHTWQPCCRCRTRAAVLLHAAGHGGRRRTPGAPVSCRCTREASTRGVRQRCHACGRRCARNRNRGAQARKTASHRTSQAARLATPPQCTRSHSCTAGCEGQARGSCSGVRSSAARLAGAPRFEGTRGRQRRRQRRRGVAAGTTRQSGRTTRATMLGNSSVCRLMAESSAAWSLQNFCCHARSSRRSGKEQPQAASRMPA